MLQSLYPKAYASEWMPHPRLNVLETIIDSTDSLHLYVLRQTPTPGSDSPRPSEKKTCSCCSHSRHARIWVARFAGSLSKVVYLKKHIRGRRRVGCTKSLWVTAVDDFPKALKQCKASEVSIQKQISNNEVEPPQRIRYLGTQGLSSGFLFCSLVQMGDAFCLSTANSESARRCRFHAVGYGHDMDMRQAAQKDTS
nr:hypothetical protein CFP56_09871 [Quercus suber]